MAHQLINALTESASEPDDAVVSALGEFRSEYIKELSKRLAGNAGDRVFGRDPEPSTHPQQAKVRETDHITHFEFNSALLRPGERDALVRYAADLVRQTGCHVMIHAYADRTGPPRDNLWLSWRRGTAVSSVLIDNGIDRRLITVVPHGYEQRSGDSVSETPAEAYATCQAGVPFAASR
jgi:outer membrane protein OmpA-like peptidoglycan-associated protein